VIGKHEPGKSIPDIMREEPTPLRIVKNDLHARGATLSWAREIYDKFGPISEDAIADDSILPFRAAILGDIAYIDEPLVYHRVGGVSWLDKKKNPRHEKMYGRRIKLFESHIASKKAMLQDLNKVELQENYKILIYIKNYIYEQNYRIDISKNSILSLILKIPYSLMISIKKINIHYIYINIKYLIYRP